MGDIPDRIWDEAWKLLRPTSTAAEAKEIAQALLAAEKRGREDGAKIAERFWVENGEGSFDDGVGLAAQQIAAAIRSGS